MGAPQDFEALKQRLIEIEPMLPKRLRQTAAFALEHPDEVALGTASGIAQRAQVQASTLVRFAQSLGFAGFSELQGVFRAHLRGRWPDYSERLKALHDSTRDAGDPMNLLHGFADSATQSIAKLRESVRPDVLRGAVDSLSAARTIYLIGQRRSFSVAHYLAYALAQLGLGSALVDNVGGLGREQIARSGSEDAVLAVSFAPYSPTTISLAEVARANKTPLIVITDSALSPLAGMANQRFEVVESDFGAFRSLSATFCLAMTLVVAIGERRAENEAVRKAAADAGVTPRRV
jgi:DNA-binding MurR/RpiR family transcriptional regulator